MSQKIKNVFKLKYMSAFVFFAFICIMLLLFIVLPRKDFLIDEKRVPAAAPVLTLENLKDGSFGEDVEDFISDHFAGRKFFVGLNAYYNYISGRGGTLNIYNSKDGYLINSPIEMNLENLNRNINILNRFAESTDVDMHLCIVPSTAYIMEDKLPALHMPYNDEKLFATVRKSLSDDIDYIDLTAPFKSYGTEEQLYYRTDHHWTTAGAYRGYIEICKALGITPADRESFTITEYEGFYGTTYSQSGYWFTEPDTVEIWESSSQESVSVYIEENGRVVKQQDSMYFTDHLDEPDMYPVFLDGNHPYTRIINEAVPEGRLVVIKDSFAHCLVPFLAAHYHEIDMVDLRYYKNSVAEIVASGADDVLVLYGLDSFVNDANFPWLTRGLNKTE